MIRVLTIFAFIGLILNVGCKDTNKAANETPPPGAFQTNKIQRPSSELGLEESRIFKTNFNEEVVLNLAPRLKQIEQHLKTHEQGLSDLLAPGFQYLGIHEFDLINLPADLSVLLHHQNAPLSQTKTSPNSSEFQLWSPMASKGSFVDTQMGILEGRLLDEEDTFLMKTKFEGRFKTTAGQLFGIKAKQKLTWSLIESNWKITSWEQLSFELVTTSRALFRNVTSEVVRDPKTLESLTNSKHEELLIRHGENPAALAGDDMVYFYFADWPSLFQYPSASVVDFDNDNDDDLFILDRYGPSIALRNQGDGTFKNVTDSIGLFIKKCFANCSVFADFDNDGDQDVLIGRSLEGSAYFKNESGKFVYQADMAEDLKMVRFVTSGSAVDINSDGLLDVYLCTYATRGGDDLSWIRYAVPPQYESKLANLVTSSHSFLDRRGPPNILLLNKQGTLRRVGMSRTLEQWRNSFQSVWTDFDNDGDQDVYICNDFAPDVFLRNDTERGSDNIQFTDITYDVFEGETMGFGMGASFGDYNSDGTLDLYVSNMYSKAGHRVVQNFDGDLDPRIEVSARGNFLFEKKDGKLKQVAGYETDDQQVAKVGWSFGGQLADFTNDGNLDIYVPSGFFTAPESVADEVDL